MAGLGTVVVVPAYTVAGVGKFQGRSTPAEVSGIATTVVLDLYTDPVRDDYPTPGPLFCIAELAIRQPGLTEITVIGTRKVYAGRTIINSWLTDGQLAAIGFGSGQVARCSLYWFKANIPLIQRCRMYFSG